MLGKILGVPDRPLDPAEAALRDEVIRQLGGAPDAPVTLPEITVAAWRPGADPGTAAQAAAVSHSDVLVAFLIVEMAIMGRILPSQQSADALAGMIAKVGETGGRDGPDQVPEERAPPDSTPFDATSPSGGHATGTMETHFSTKAERSLVTVDLDRQLVLNYTAPPSSTAESGTTTITIHNTDSVDFCPDVGGVVPVKLMTTFTMALPASTVSATVEGSFLGLVDDSANLVFTNGHARVTRLTVTGGETSTDADVQLMDVTIDPSGSSTVGRYDWQTITDVQAAGDAVGAAEVDLEKAVPVVLKAAQKAWQHSACVAVQLPDFGAYASGMGDGSGQKDVDPGSTTEFTAQVHHRFEHREVNLPIKVTLQSEKRVDPPRLPTTPSKVTYEAPDKPNAHNAVTLEVVSKRGKSKLVMHFDTKETKLQAKVDGTVHTDAGGNRYDTEIHLKPLDLTAADDGSFQGHATVSWTTTYRPPTAACKPVTYKGTFETDVIVIIDPEDPTKVVFTASFIPGVLKQEKLVCTGRTFPFNGGTSLGSWATLAGPHSLVLGAPTKIPSTAAFGTASNTVTVTKKPSS